VCALCVAALLALSLAPAWAAAAKSLGSEGAASKLTEGSSETSAATTATTATTATKESEPHNSRSLILVVAGAAVLLLSGVAFVIVRGEAADGSTEIELAERLREHVGREIGAIAKPRRILVVPELPKTRSGKIMRRLLRDVAEQRQVGDITTLADTTVMDLIQQRIPAAAAEDAGEASVAGQQ